MQIDKLSDLVLNIEYCDSPNQDERPKGAVVDLIIVHGISLPPGEFGNDYVKQLFTNVLDCKIHPYFKQIEQLHVSAHLFIKRDGEVIQFVPFQRRAWHAGQSSFLDKDSCNDFSIGIELEGTDNLPYETIQYQRLVDLCQSLMQIYPQITQERIVGHADVAPNRKTDPGPAFDWHYFRKLMRRKYLI